LQAVSLPEKQLIRTQLSQLSDRLIETGAAELVELVLKCRVPVLRVWECKSELYFDITIGSSEGPNASRWVRVQLDQFPILRPLCLLLKQLLHNNHLGTPYWGGLGGYCLTCVVVSFLKHEHATSPAPAESEQNTDKLDGTNSGMLEVLLRMLNWLVKAFDYDSSSIAPGRPNGKCLKTEVHAATSQVLTIEDPLGPPGRDIAAACWSWQDVLALFGQLRELVQTNLTTVDLSTVLNLQYRKPDDQNPATVGNKVKRDHNEALACKKAKVSWGDTSMQPAPTRGSGWGSVVPPD
jgi:DNA polymerase sigma